MGLFGIIVRHKVNRISEKIIKKQIAKETQKGNMKMEQEYQDTYYMGRHIFGMELYATMKISSRLIYLIVAILLLASLIAEKDAAIIAITALLLWAFTFFMTRYTKKTSGIILYTNDYIRICKSSGETHTFSIAGLKSIERKGRNFVYTGVEGTAKVLGGGEGIAALFAHLEERRPELIKPLYSISQVMYVINDDLYSR